LQGKNDVSKQGKVGFWVDRVTSRYPFPGGERNLLIRMANLLIISSFLPIFGYAYVRIQDIDPVPEYPLGPILMGIVVFFFFYGATLVFVSRRILEFFPRIRPTLDLDEKQQAEFVERSSNFIFRPSKYLLAVLLATTPLGQYSLSTSGLIRGDLVVMGVVFAMILLASLFNWVGAWALIAFFRTVRRFGRDVQMKINPFSPDHIGGLEPLSDLTTLGLLIISVLTALAIPIWYLFSKPTSVMFALVTSIVIPVYLYLSMDKIYACLRADKLRGLAALSDELETVNHEIQSFVELKHRTRISHRELAKISSDLVAIQTIYKSIDQMRTFPVNTKMLIKVASTMLVPILSLILTRLAEVAWSLLV
jgi:hypothetical protein